MSSSEQAPEPTMDEILASIRKIIADDDDSAAPAPDASVGAAPEEGAGQSGLASDIANALNQTTPPADNEDDILDLTNKVPEAGHAAPPPSSPAEAYAPPPQQQPETPPAPEPVVSPAAPMPPAAAGVAGQSQDILAGAPMEESALPESTTGFGAPERAPVDASWPENESSPAGDLLRTTAPEPHSGDGEITDLDRFAPGQRIGGGSDLVDAAYAESGVVAGKTVPESAIDPGPDLGAMSLETPPAVGGMESHELPGDDKTAAMDTVSSAEPQDSVMVPPPPATVEPAEQAVAEEQDKSEAAASSGLTLEESVKQMLRPMLREWLDDNMQRIVEDAVKDELHNKHNQF